MKAREVAHRRLSHRPQGAKSRSPQTRRKGNGHDLDRLWRDRQTISNRRDAPLSRSAPSPASPAFPAAGKSTFHNRHALRCRSALAQRRTGRLRASMTKVEGLEYLRQGDRDRPVAHRSHSALQPRDLYRRLHQYSRLVRRPPRKPRRAATNPAASPSTSKAGAAKQCHRRRR